MDPDGMSSQHPFDDFDHVRPLRPSQDLDLISPVLDSTGPNALVTDPFSRPQSTNQSSQSHVVACPTAFLPSSESFNTISTVLTTHSTASSVHTTHTTANHSSSTVSIPTLTSHSNIMATATNTNSHSSGHTSSNYNNNSNSSNNNSYSNINNSSNYSFINNNNNNHGQSTNPNYPHLNTHSHSTHTYPNHNYTHQNHSPLGPPIPPQAPASSSSSSLATTAVSRFSQAFSPLLSARRRSTAIDLPSTPDGHKTTFPYSISGSAYASPGSLHGLSDGPYSASQERLATTGSSVFENNFSKIASFSSPRSSTRTKKTLPTHISHVPEESGYGSFDTPPHTATAFHTGLASHFGAGSTSSQSRDQHEGGHHKELTGKGSIVGGSSTIEKALKKAKVFMDEKAKPKARAASLWTFLDATFEFDQAKFFQEHADQVFTVTHDSFWHQIEKFKQKPDRNNALQSKEVLAIQKTLLLLRLIFLYLPDRMKNGWHRRPIANMLAQVLCHKNHPRIRIFGFRLLLLWINDQTVEYPEAIYLFSNAISLDLFMYDGEDLSIDHASSSQTKLPHISNGSTGRKSAKHISQYLDLAHVNLSQERLLSDGPPICPNPAPPTFQDSIQLFQIFLANIVRMAYVAAGSTPPAGELESINSHYPIEADGEIGDGIAVGFGIDAGMAAARFMFDIIKKYYLVKVFPECARNIQLLREEGKDFGYKTCPPTILRTIISFVIQYCLDSNDINSPQTHTSPATPILKSIVYASEVNREIMHEIVRQGLSLPPGHPQYKDIVRGAVHIVGVWCLSGEEERPVFLRSTANRTHAPSTSSLASLGDQSGFQSASQSEPYSTANSFLQRYFQLLTNVFAENAFALHDNGSNSSSEALGSIGNQTKLDMEALYHQYKDILGVFRAIMVRGQIEMDTKTWEVLLSCLLQIFRRVMNLQDRLVSPMPASFADDLASNVVETALCAHSRCPSVSNAQWLALRKTMVDSLRWPQVIAQWIRWSVRLTHVLGHEVFQVDLDAPVTRPTQSSTSRHGRKMSDNKFRHSRYLTSKTEAPMRHSIGGELLSSQGIAYPHQTYPMTSERSRRANSVHYDPAKQSGPTSNSVGSNAYNPSLLGHIGFLPGRDSAREHHSSLRIDVGELDEDEPFDYIGSHISALAEATEGNDERLSRASSLSFHGPDSLHLDPIVERLSSQYGIFASPEFVNISMKGRSTDSILSVWKNIVCSIGNPNAIQIPLVKTEVMLCLIDVWDLLNQIRGCQPLNATIIPPLYDFAPWFFEAARSTSDGGVGLPAIYGGLCRMMSRRFDQDFDPEFYRLFYDSVIQGLLIDDSMIGHSILANSSRLFTLSLPGSHILVLPFLNAIRQMLLKDGHLRDGVNHFIRKQAIAILCSVSMLFYDFEHHANSPAAAGISHHHPLSGGDLLSYKLTFTRLVIDLTSAEAYVKPLGKFWDTHSMLIQLCGMLVVNEWSSSLATCDIGAESELLLLVLDHLYWTEASIVQSTVEVITTLAGMYKGHEDNGWIVLEMVLSHLLSAMQEHLKMFQVDARRGTMIASFYRCLVEWLMVIPASIFSETELSKWVFELIEVGLLLAPDSTGENERKRALQAAKQQQQQQQHAQQHQYHHLRTGRKRGPSFRHTGKAIHQHHRIMISTGPVVDIEIEQQTIKEAAEATLIHLVHFFNNAPACRGSDRALVTLGMDPSNDGVNSGGKSSSGPKPNSSADDHQRIFALNDSILITIEEVPCARQGTYRTRIVLRDETGRYAWDSEIFYREMLQLEDSRPRSVQRTGSRVSERFGSTSSRRRKAEMASQLIWREGIQIRDDESFEEPRVTTPPAVPSPAGTATSIQPIQGIESLLWEGTLPKSEGDRLDQLLRYVGQQHADCLFDGKTPLNQLNNGMALSTEPRTAAQIGGHGPGHNGLSRRTTIDFELDRHVQEESYYTRISDPQARAWYDKLVELRSSLIQEDDDIDEFHGSNTLMSLVVNANWSGSEDQDGPTPKIFEKDTDHEALYQQAKQNANRRIKHDNLHEIHAEAMRREDHELSREQEADRRLLMDSYSAPNQAESGAEASQRKEDAFSMAKAFQLALPPEAERPLDSYQHSRLLLSHLGLLCFDRFQEHNFVLLNPSAALERDLKNLDKKSGRETFKIAVLYVAAGQEGEQAILHNAKGSAAYNRFVQDLGWEVELAEHSGYIGGLERNGSNGRSAIYYSSSTLEVIFHEVVKMPTDPDDARQVKKKRHVGNDHVHIVWSEHSRAYDRNTIGGDFGNVIIVLSPVRELSIDEDGITQTPTSRSGANLVSVEVIRDMNLPVFGPLVDGMVVPMSQLGRLVRQTAIHAARLATAPPPLPPTPPSAGFSASSASGSGGSSINMGTGGIGGGGLTGAGGLHHRSSLYQTHTVSGGGGGGSNAGGISSAMQGHQYHQSNLSVPPGSNTGGSGSGSTLLGVGSGSTGLGAGIGSTGGIMATLSATATATSAALLGPNVGSGPNGASASSLVSNSGSTHGSNGSQSGSGGSGPGGMNGVQQANGGGGGSAAASMVVAGNGIGAGAILTNNTSMQLQAVVMQQHQHLQQQQQQTGPVVSQSIPAVTTTASSSALASSTGVSSSSFAAALLHHGAHSIHPFKQRAQSIEQIAKRHKVEKWTFQQFMEQVFGYSTHLHPHPSRGH